MRKDSEQKNGETKIPDIVDPVAAYKVEPITAEKVFYDKEIQKVLSGEEEAKNPYARSLAIKIQQDMQRGERIATDIGQLKARLKMLEEEAFRISGAVEAHLIDLKEWNRYIKE